MTGLPEDLADSVHPAWQLGFSTLGCPSLSYLDACHLVTEYELDFIELRSLAGSLDLPAYFEGYDFGIEARALPPIRALGTSLYLIGAAPEDLKEFYRFAHLAHRLNAPYLRVFGKKGDFRKPPSPQEFEHGRKCIEEIRSELLRLHFPCELILETHDSFCASDVCLRLSAGLKEPLSMLWDSHHTWRLGGESPEFTWQKLGSMIRHIHYKDSGMMARKDEPSYVLPGDGDYPTRALIELLRGNGYSQGISLEWEKLWHPELLPFTDALSKFCEVWTS